MWRELAFILVGEVIVSLLVALAFYLIGLGFPDVKLDLSVVLGTLLGSFVALLNYSILSIAVNRAVDKYLEALGERELTEEEADEFAKENSPKIALAAQGTYMLRMLLMVGVLVVAFLFKGVFNVIATVVPLLAFKPIIYVLNLIKKKNETKGEI